MRSPAMQFIALLSVIRIAGIGRNMLNLNRFIAENVAISGEKLVRMDY